MYKRQVPQEFVRIINEHGGKMPDAIGIPEEMLRQAATMAVCKINIDSDLRLVMTGTIRKYLAENPSHFDPRQYLKPAREAIKQMVSGGVGVAVLSALAVEQEVQNGTLLAFEMDKSALKRTIYLITLKSQQLSRMEQKLVDFLKSPHRRKRAEAQN